MNRLIKFRLYCPYNKEMYYDDDENYELRIQNGEFSYIPIDDDSYCFYSNIADDLENECLNIIPMQFTGLYDKNGKEIYEGDILKDFDWRVPEPVFWASSVDEYDFDGWLCKHFHPTSNCEIVGNIHENSELLKQL